MNKPHKHAALIKAWADGAVIQVKDPDGRWRDCLTPGWGTDYEYRIKPEPTEIVQWHLVTSRGDRVFWTGASVRQTAEDQQVKWTIDPETKKILKVELVE